MCLSKSVLQGCPESTLCSDGNCNLEMLPYLEDDSGWLLGDGFSGHLVTETGLQKLTYCSINKTWFLVFGIVRMMM